VPVDIDRFERGEGLRTPTTSERVVRFLAANDDHAYTRREIADAIDADPETVGTNLSRLKDRGLVRHREPYWAFTTDRDHAAEVLRARYDDAVVADLLGTTPSHDRPASRTAPAEAERGASEADGASDDAGDGPDSEDDPEGSSRQSRDEPTRTHRAAARAFFRRVQDCVGDGVDELDLFGSLARADATADSDVDVLAVVSTDADYAVVDDRLLELAYDVQLEYGVRIEVHSIRADEFAARRDRGDPFVRTVVEEGLRGG
jgi:predicted nucleotidyltransferase